MILAMLYCLTEKIQFVLYSKDANFGYEKGWTDYFLPFCDEISDDFNKKYNFRDYEFFRQKLNKKDKLKIRFHKLIHGIDFFTQDLWLLIRDREHEKKVYNIPELGIKDSSLRDACRSLINITWEYNPIVKTLIKDKINSLNLPDEYIGFHIRRGDKVVEQELIDISAYFQKIEETFKKNAFILTDDYRVISEIREKYPQWNIYTLCKETEIGYNHANFKRGDKAVIRDSHINLFASLDILSLSQCFIGTFGSNPGMFLGMRTTQGKCISLDVDWQIW
ncbi:hypothetical protein [Dysgonomonas sp. 521]|uniref:hypothetical protein n=1 Tax=Dysgonomonas sp. 521 TaxID=2302932 RepID=UPI0013D65B17|nr:hypothetical protein [Dysgonomonas sp. 521]